MAMKREDSLVHEIIERYGETIDLRQSPFVILEIIRQFGPRLAGNPVADCLPPGGPPPKLPDPDEVIRQIRMHLGEVDLLSATLLEAIAKPGR